MHSTRGARATEEEPRRDGQSSRSPEQEAPEEQRWRYVRTVYPLNPGIPHFLDFPLGRD